MLIPYAAAAYHPAIPAEGNVIHEKKWSQPRRIHSVSKEEIMPISSYYDKEKKVLHINLEGEVLLNDLDQLYKDIVTSREFPPDIRSIWDFRKTDFTLVNKNYMEKVFTVRKNYPERGNARAAFVADNDLSFGVTRMYETLSSFELPQHISVFRDFLEAEEWILSEE